MIFEYISSDEETLKDIAKNDKSSRVRKTAIEVLNSITENATGYSLTRMAEAYDSNSPISYRMVGYPEDLDMITEKN